MKTDAELRAGLARLRREHEIGVSEIEVSAREVAELIEEILRLREAVDKVTRLVEDSLSTMEAQPGMISFW